MPRLDGQISENGCLALQGFLHFFSILRKKRKKKEKMVNLGKRSALVFSLKTQNINENHFILCSSIYKMMRKTLITTQQARGTSGGNRGFWMGRIKVIEITTQLRGTLWKCGVLGGEHRLYDRKNYLNWGFAPQPPFMWGALPSTPPFS